MSASAGGRSYTVAPGDSFYRISERFLKSGARWEEIYELNKSVVKDPSRLRPGQVIKLPAE